MRAEDATDPVGYIVPGVAAAPVPGGGGFGFGNSLRGSHASRFAALYANEATIAAIGGRQMQAPGSSDGPCVHIDGPV
jgi:hypothetical protein